MLTVSNDMLESLDQIFYTGARGTHLLFSTSNIRDAFVRLERVEPVELENLTEQLQPVLATLLELSDNEDRRDFIEALEPSVRDVLVHVYFGFLEKYLTEDEPPEVLH
jgi:hypothetical protein